jgi:hypothetical protein
MLLFGIIGELLAESLRPLTSLGRAPKHAASVGGRSSSGDCGAADGLASAHGRGRKRDGVEGSGAGSGGHRSRGESSGEGAEKGAGEGAESALVRRLLKTIERLQMRLAEAEVRAEVRNGPGGHAGGGGAMETLRQELEVVKEENAKLRVENGNMYALFPCPPPRARACSLSLPPSLSLSLSLSLCIS